MKNLDVCSLKNALPVRPGYHPDGRPIVDPELKRIRHAHDTEHEQEILERHAIATEAKAVHEQYDKAFKLQRRTTNADELLQQSTELQTHIDALVLLLESLTSPRFSSPEEAERFKETHKALVQGYKRVDSDFLWVRMTKEFQDELKETHLLLLELREKPLARKELEQIERHIQTLRTILATYHSRLERQRANKSATSDLKDLALEEAQNRHGWKESFEAWINALDRDVQEKHAALDKAERNRKEHPERIHNAQDVLEVARIHDLLRRSPEQDQARAAKHEEKRLALAQIVDQQEAELQKRLGVNEIPDTLPHIGFVDRVREKMRTWWGNVRNKPLQPVERVFKEFKQNQRQLRQLETLAHPRTEATHAELLERPEQVVERRSLLRTYVRDLEQRLVDVRYEREPDTSQSAREKREQFMERLHFFQQEYDQTFKPTYDRMTFAEQSLMRELKERLETGQRWAKHYRQDLHRMNLKLLEASRRIQKKPGVKYDEAKPIVEGYRESAEEEWLANAGFPFLQAKRTFLRELKELSETKKDFYRRFRQLSEAMRFRDPKKDRKFIESHPSFREMDNAEKKRALDLLMKTAKIRFHVSLLEHAHELELERQNRPESTDKKKKKQEELMKKAYAEAYPIATS